MNGLNNIIARIDGDARAECEVILADTAKNAFDITEEYKSRADELYGAALKEGAVSAKSQYDRLINTAQMESKKLVLTEKQTLLGEAFATAVHSVRKLPEGEYVALLARLAAEGSRDGGETLHFARGEGEKFGASVVEAANKLLASRGKPASLKLGGTRDIAGGVVVAGEETEVNCGVDTLVAQLRRELETDVASALFD
jgi:V/A-type H+-transporting ATPase subunit E